MRIFSRKKPVTSFAIAMVVAYALSSVVLSYFDVDMSALPYRFEEGHLLARNSHELSSEERDGIEDEVEAEYLEQLLADSILSIIKTYYVDSQRVSNANLLRLTLDSLANNLGFEVKREGQSYQLNIQGRVAVIAYSDHISYEKLLKTLISVARFIDAGPRLANLKTAEDDSIESNGTAIVFNAMLMALDAHSALLSATSYEELKQGTEGTFGGLGVLVGMRDQLLTVIKPLPRSPAERMGITRRDRILAIDGQDTYGFTLADLVDYMRGAPGSEVKLSLLRDSSLAAQDVYVKREVILVDSVTSKLMPEPFGNVLVLAIETFSARTAQEIAEILKTYHQSNKEPLKGIVLDLRSNPGGLLDQAVQVVDLFIPQGTIVTTKGRREEKESAQRDAGEESCPMVVLINEESASASEIVAGALQDHGRAIIVGQPSFGKGSVQTIFELPHNRALKLTIARYYTPAGRSIQNVGIMPDIWIQPVYQQAANANLLGGFRYRNERFLANHLVSGTRPAASALVAKGLAWQGFYMAAPPDEFSAEKKDDHELMLAQRIFERLYLVYKGDLARENGRASHWLSLASPSIHASLGEWDRKVDSYLTQNHGVNWRKQEASKGELRLEAKNPSPIAVKPGDEIELDFVIRNQGRHDVGRVSVYVRSSHAGVDTLEELVGVVKAGEKRHERLAFKVPTYWQAGTLPLETGLAVAGYPVASDEPHIFLDVSKRPTPSLKLDRKAITGEQGGNVAGKLEPKETATLVVHLKNDSDLPARGLTIKAYNLTGKQLVLPGGEQQIQAIPPHTTRVISFPVEGGEQVVGEVMAVGLSVESNDLEKPYREKITFEAVSGGRRVDKASSHHSLDQEG